MVSPAWQFLLDLAAIIFVNLVLSGDNAVVIALAVKTLAPGRRGSAILAGAGCAVLVRVAATFFAGQLLHIEFLKLIGGLTILWIAAKLFSEAAPEGGEAGARPSSLWHAMWFILLADITMSLDNILAIAQVAHGDLVLLLLGLGTSIPLVLFASGLLATLMDRFPIIVYLGAALLGKIGAEMALTDRFVSQIFSPSPMALYALEAAAAAGVVVVGRLLLARAVPAPADACEPR